MPDITMCCDKSCKIKNTCYRYMAIPSPYMQSQSKFENRDKDNCEYFVKIDKHDRVRTLDERDND
jgi:hypothetical protein